MNLIIIYIFLSILSSVYCERYIVSSSPSSPSSSKDINYSKISQILIQGNIAEIKKSFNVLVSSSPSISLEVYHTISFEEISSNIDEKSIRITASVKRRSERSATSIEILDTSTYTVINTKKSNNQKLINVLKEENDKLNLDIERLQSKQKSLLLFSENAMSNIYVNNNKESKDSSTILKDVNDIILFVDNQLKDIINDLNHINRRKKEIQDEILLLSDNEGTINNGYTNSNSNTMGLNIHIKLKLPSNNNNENDELIFEITYFSTPVSWKAEHDIFIDTSTTTITTEVNNKNKEFQISSSLLPSYVMNIESYANVVQMTGENWNDVSVVLSTTSPKRSLPNPKPFKRGIYIDEWHGNDGFHMGTPQMMYASNMKSNASPRG